MRHLRLFSLAVLSLAAFAACSSATPGWTYAPAPSVTPAPSGAASAGMSGAPASGAPAPSAASGAPAPSAASGAPAPSSTPAASSATGAVVISASGIKYEQTTVSAPAGKPFQISFENKDAGTPHNVVIHQGDASGAVLFSGVVFSGVETRAYDVPALAAGTYAFVCIVHPTMVGTLNVQ